MKQTSIVLTRSSEREEVLQRSPRVSSPSLSKLSSSRRSTRRTSAVFGTASQNTSIYPPNLTSVNFPARKREEEKARQGRNAP